jgi:hypothetical protein
MAIHTTRWSPDTCSCVIEYTWDDNDPPEARPHNLSTYVNKCAEHTILAADNTRYDTVKEENSRKNIAHQGILDNGPSSLYDLTPEGSRVLKGGITISWSWTGTPPNRVITLTYTGITLTTNQRNTAQTWLNNRFGAGKVILA